MRANYTRYLRRGRGGNCRRIKHDPDKQHHGCSPGEVSVSADVKIETKDGEMGAQTNQEALFAPLARLLLG